MKLNNPILYIIFLLSFVPNVSLASDYSNSDFTPLVDKYHLTLAYEGKYLNYYYDSNEIHSFDKDKIEYLELVSSAMRRDYNALYLNKDYAKRFLKPEWLKKVRLKTAVILTKKDSRIMSNTHMVGFYLPAYNEIVISMSASKRTFVHEYTHSLTTNDSFTPIWAVEGLSLFMENGVLGKDHKKFYAGFFNPYRIQNMLRSTLFSNPFDENITFQKISTINKNKINAQLEKGYDQKSYDARYANYIVVNYLSDRGMLIDVLSLVKKEHKRSIMPFGYYIKKISKIDKMGIYNGEWTEEKFEKDFDQFSKKFISINRNKLNKLLQHIKEKKQ